MDLTKKASGRVDQVVESTQRQLERLRSAAALRRRLPPGSPLYASALDDEERLAKSLWRRIDNGGRSRRDASD
jgi:hypothetical protein